MPKRKAASAQLDEPDRSKQQRADSASSPSIDADGARAILATQIAAHTLAMSRALTSDIGSLLQRMHAVIDLLKEEVDRAEPLVDWSRASLRSKSCVLFQLLRFFDSSGCEDFPNHVFVKILPRLLRSFDPAAVDAKTGNNTLHEMCRLFAMSHWFDWGYKFAKRLINHGVSVDARNKKGRTPLLEYAATATPHVKSASVMRLLLSHGAELNAQDNDGNGVLHHLIMADAVDALNNFCTRGGGVSRLDCFISNAACQNPFDLVAARLAKRPGDWTAQKMSQILKKAQTALWDKHTRPVLQLHLHQVLTVPDLAEMVLGFLDGSERPSDHAAMQTENEDPSAAAAAAAARS